MSKLKSLKISRTSKSVGPPRASNMVDALMDITYVGCVSDVERMFAGEWCASHGSYYIYVAFGFAFSFRAFQRWVGRLTGPRNCLDIGLRL